MRVRNPRLTKAMSTPRRRALWRAWVATLTVTVLAIAPLLAILHQISARHAVCEHGQLVESGHENFDFTRLGAVADPAGGEANTTVDAESDSAEHGHRHCSLGTLARAGAGECPRAELIAELLPGGTWSPVDRDFAVAVTTLSNAPKTSPPAA